MKQTFLIALLALCLTSFGQRPVTIPIPDSLHAFRFAKIYKTETDFYTKKTDTVLGEVFGFDQRRNICYILDAQGLYFANVYDSLNNLQTEYYYEAFDAAGKRIPTAMHQYYYENGLATRVEYFTWKNDAWQLKDVLRKEYAFDAQGKVVMYKYFYDNSPERQVIIRYQYADKKAAPEAHPDFNSGWFAPKQCAQETREDATGKIISTTRYTYDDQQRCISAEKREEKNVHLTTYRYNDAGLVTEERVYRKHDGVQTLSWQYDYAHTKEGFPSRSDSGNEEGMNSTRWYVYTD